jgi:hypothetical protein
MTLLIQSCEALHCCAGEKPASCEDKLWIHASNFFSYPRVNGGNNRHKFWISQKAVSVTLLAECAILKLFDGGKPLWQHSIHCLLFQAENDAPSFRPECQCSTRTHCLYVHVVTMSANSIHLCFSSSISVQETNQELSHSQCSFWTVPFNGYNSETSSGKTMKLHIKLHVRLIEWMQFSWDH